MMIDRWPHLGHDQGVLNLFDQAVCFWPSSSISFRQFLNSTSAAVARMARLVELAAILLYCGSG